MDLPLFHILLQIRLQRAFVTSLASGWNAACEILQKRIKIRGSTVVPTSRRPATVPRDENLEANSPAAVAESSRRNGSHDP
jgi:hypothetical protein